MTGMMSIEAAGVVGQVSKVCPPSVVQTLEIALHDSVHDVHLHLDEAAGCITVADDRKVRQFSYDGIARLRHGDPEAGPFSERFVFPDAAPLHISRVLVAIEAAGLEPTHVEGFRLDYARTLTEWGRNLDEHAERAEALAGPERMRIWRLYVRAARRGFENGFTSIFQVVAHRPH